MIELENVKIKFDYSSPEIEDISRCLETLYSTREGTQPLDRKFGLKWDFIDKPLPIAQQEYAFEVIKKTKEYEPRAVVKEVTYTYNEENGNMIPVILLVKGEQK